MAKPTRNQKLLFEQLIDKLEPGVRDAFAAMVDDLHAGVDWKSLLAALKAGDVEAAVAAMHIEAAAFQTLAASMSGAYAAGGAVAAATINGGSGARVLFRFAMSNPVAEAWVRQNVGQMITGRMIPETLEAIRKVIADGYSRGEGPLTIATDLAGRVENGVRKGGLLGLDAPRAARLQAVTVGMRSPEGVRSLVVMGADGIPRVKYKVNPATAKRILAAYNKGTAVPEAQRILSEKQYTSLLLKARADTIARTETGQAVMSARYEAWRQAAAAEGYGTDAISKTWRHGSHSKQARPEHIAMNNVTVKGLYTPFEFPNGVRKQHALDGVGFGRHDINCGCGTDFRLNRAKGLK